MSEIIFEQGDICKQKVEAIVNPANSELLHGGGLAATIVSVGGDIIQEQSNNISPIQLGEAAVTEGGKLFAKYVIHAASMNLGEITSEDNLKSSIINSLKRADELGIKSIAFPAIGTGYGQISIKKCAEISLNIANDFLKKESKIEKLIFVLHSEEDLQIFQNKQQRIIKQ